MSTMFACFMKFAYYHHVQNHLYKKMILIASKVFLGLETIITTHKKQIGTC
jgi:hypothetical protein